MARKGWLRGRLAFMVATLTAVAVTAAGAPTAGAGGAGKGKATGDPIVIGIYTPADNQTFTAPELIDGAEAAAKYVNSQLEGVGGSPIQLETCKSDYSAPGLTACANKLFEKDPLIIIPGPDAAALTVQSTFDETGIPLIGGASFTPPEYTSPTRAVFNGFSASLFPAMVHFAVDKLGAKKLTALSVDDPSNQIIKGIFMDPIAEANGLPKPEYVSSPAGSADLTSTFAAALDSDPDALLPFGLPCLPAFQAYQSLGTDVPMIMPDNCADTETLKKAGDQADGVYFVELYEAPGVAKKSKDVKLYTKQMKKYAKGVVDTDFSRAGFGTIMNIHALLDGEDPASLTHESVLAAFKGTNDQPNFLNTPYSCASPPLAQYPGVCAGSAYLVRDKGGKLKRQSPFVTLDVLFAGKGG
jgi:branched-chain amino acid transport system substrate-binding protein